jgi:hypothetical protein
MYRVIEVKENNFRLYQIVVGLYSDYDFAKRFAIQKQKENNGCLYLVSEVL